MKYLSVLNKHKTKLFGLVTMVTSYVTGFPGLDQMMSPLAYQRTLFVVGAVTTLLGFLNTRAGKKVAQVVRPPVDPSHP